MSFGNKGWDIPDQAGGENKVSKFDSFWIKPGTTRRIMFLQSEPFTFFAHNLYFWNKTNTSIVCLKEEKVNGGICPICDAEQEQQWPRFVGALNIIDLGEVTSDGKEVVGYTSEKGTTYRDQLKYMLAKAGSKTKEGVLRKLMRYNNKRNGLQYCVFDVYRGGSKDASVGSDFSFIKKLKPEEVVDYLVECGGSKKDILSKKYKENMFDFAEIFKPWSVERIQRLVNNKLSGNVVASQGSNSSSNEFQDEDDIPF